jgi:hypothetical protein
MARRNDALGHGLLEFMQRLAAPVPRPRPHLIRFHGVLAPNAKLRPLVVPQGPEVQERTTEVAAASECEAETLQARPHRISWARLLKRVVATTSLEYKLVCVEASLSTSTCSTARTAAPGS